MSLTTVLMADPIATAPPTAVAEVPSLPPDNGFRRLNLILPLQQAIEMAGYKNPTPIQEALIPQALTGRDVIGQAQTGTGKTAAFLIPFMNRWRGNKVIGPQALVLAPTRELVLQVAQEADRLAPSRRFITVAVYGGRRLGGQAQQLQAGCSLLIGTPGRILDHLQRGTLTLEHVRYLVLDEADRMLDFGFRPDIERILRHCPQQRQTLLMSATVPDEIMKLSHRYLRDPVHINMVPEVLTVDKIQQRYLTVDEDKKPELLLKVIEREAPRQCIIFCETKRGSDRLYRKLKLAHRATAVIHGDLPQSQRERIMAAFRAAKIRFLIATDIVGRGIDVSGISHIINYDLPHDIENYVHRIGRTGRMGKDGVAISFVTPDQGAELTAIEQTINRLIDPDSIDGGPWYTPRRKTSEVPSPPPVPIYGRPRKKYSQRL